jgi:thiol-disulfide isomerase/thioredoxin
MGIGKALSPYNGPWDGRRQGAAVEEKNRLRKRRMNTKWKALIWAAVLAAILAAAILLYNALAPETVPAGGISLEEEKTEREALSPLRAPDFRVQDSTGTWTTLSAQFGKPLVINFWASWCPPCKQEMPAFEQVYRELKEDIRFMMIDMADGQRETKATGEAFVAAEGYTFPVFYDTAQEAAYTCGITALPSTLFIDAEGYIIAGVQGAIHEETLRLGIRYITEGFPEGDDR